MGKIIIKMLPNELLWYHGLHPEVFSHSAPRFFPSRNKQAWCPSGLRLQVGEHDVAFSEHCSRRERATLHAHLHVYLQDG